MIVLLISLVLANVCLVSSQQQLGLPDNNRIYSTNTDIGVNLIAQVNSSFQFPLVIKPNNRVSLWLLARQTIQSYKANDPNLVDSLPIYYPGMVRSSNLTSAFNCLPSEDNCQQIRIPTFDITQVGVYSFRFDSANFLTTTKFQFNVSALASSIRLDCFSSNASCQYNPATNVISVLADQSVSISCGVDVVQNDDYPFSAHFKLMADTYEDCLGQNSTLARFSSSIPNTSNYNLLYSRLNKTCLTKFSIQDSNKKYSCLLNPTPVSSTETASYQPTQTYQTFSATLDVQYGPDPTLPLNPIPKSYEYLFNKTIMVGTQTNFTCPFNGNPTPNYYWRIVSSSVSGSASANDSLSKSTDFSLSSQDYTISRNLQVGSYVFECKAQVGGLVNNYSQTIQFSLTIIPPPTPVVKNDDATNVGAIVGGVIGGVALLILIIVVVSLFVLYGRKRNSKDEIEKAKDNETNIEKQDIDIDIRPPETYDDDVDDEGGFKPTISEDNLNADTRVPPPLPKTLPPSESSSSLKQYNDLNENSSLANNKIPPWQTASSHSNFSRQFQQLPILNLNTNLSNQTPPTPKKRINNNNTTSNNEVDVNNNLENLTLSSTSLSIRQNDERKPSTYKNLNDITTSATEFFHSTNVGSSHGLNLINDPSNSTNINNYGVYSPSNAEARHLAETTAAVSSSATAADSILSLAAKQHGKQPTQQLFSNNNNNYSSNTSSTLNATTSNAQQLSIPKGAIKVLPTSTAPLKKFNPNPLESPPPYESALHQPMSLKKESPIEQQRLNQQQKDYMGSQNRLISEQNTPTQQKHAISQSYTATPQHVANATSTTNSITNTPNHVNSTLQQLGYQNQSNIQYTSVHNLGARSRNPLNGLPNDMDSQTQYSTIAAQLSSNPIDV